MNVNLNQRSLLWTRPTHAFRNKNKIQVIRNCQWNTRGRALAQEKYIRTKSTQMSKFPELKEISPKFNIAENLFETWGKFKRKVSKYWYIDKNNHKCRCYFRELAQKLIYHIYISVKFKIECFWSIFSFEKGLRPQLVTWFKQNKR